MAYAYPDDKESPVSSSDEEEESIPRPSHDNVVEFDVNDAFKEPSFDSTKFYPLNMCVDRKTEMYVKFAKILVICQGPYPESRNTAMLKIGETFPSCGRVITDELFCKLCQTSCMLNKTPQFLEFFVEQAKIAFETACTLVVVDASISTAEMNWKLVEMAYKMQYVVLVVPPVVEAKSFAWKRKSLANEFYTKGNPVDKRRYQTNVKLPFAANGFKHLFCGWFLNDVDSEALRSAALTYIEDCFLELPAFFNFVSSKFAKDMRELKTYYNMDDDRQYVSYCVVKDLSAFHLQKEYFQQDDVIKNHGRISRLTIVGFILSPDMIAARVLLRRNQRGLWGRADMIDEIKKADFRFPCPSDYFDKLKALQAEDVRLVGSKSRETLEYTRNDAFEINPRMTGKGCHIVTGRRKGAKNADVDYGVQFALHRELKAFQNKNDIEKHELSQCSVKQIGQYWFINLKKSITVDGFFATFSEPYNFDEFLGQTSGRSGN